MSPILKLLAVFVVLAMVLGCASKKEEVVEKKPEEVITAGDPGVCIKAQGIFARGSRIPYSGGMEGNYQNGFASRREVAAEGLEKYKSRGAPDISDTDQYLNYLSVLDAAGKSADFEKGLKRMIAEYPDEKRTQFLIAVHYLRKKKVALAIHLFKQLEKEEKFAWKSLVYNNLAIAALDDGDRVSAIEYLDKAIKFQPPAAAPHANLGALFLQSKSYKRAEDMFRRAVEIDAGFEDAVLGLGIALSGQGKDAEAHNIYSSFLEDHPGAVSAVYNDAIVLGNRLGNREKAAELMLRYIQRGGKETAKAHEIINTWR